MNRIEIEVLRVGTALNGFKQAWRRAARGKSGASKLAFGTLALGLIGKDERGRLTAPFDEIVIRAELRAAA